MNDARGRRRRLASAGLGVAALVCIFAQGAEESSVPDLTGRWAMQIVMSQIGDVPFFGERVRTTTSRVVLDVSQEGVVVTATEAACSTVIDSGTSAVRTEIPAAFLRSLPLTRWEAELVSGPLGVDFLRPWVTAVQGALLQDPENDALPTQADDPRVVDQDEDGSPGLTVRIAVMGLIDGDVYVVQRDRARLVGVVLSADAVEGLVEWTSEQSILGASSPFLASGSVARPDPVAEHSYFRAVRVPEGTSCDEILRNAAALFGL